MCSTTSITSTPGCSRLTSRLRHSLAPTVCHTTHVTRHTSHSAVAGSWYFSLVFQPSPVWTICSPWVLSADVETTTPPHRSSPCSRLWQPRARSRSARSTPTLSCRTALCANSVTQSRSITGWWQARLSTRAARVLAGFPTRRPSPVRNQVYIYRVPHWWGIMSTYVCSDNYACSSSPSEMSTSWFYSRLELDW